MTTDGACLLTEAEDDDRTIEETLDELQERNRRLEWDVSTMLPEVTDTEPNEGHHSVHADY